jgi:hypothetical protein
MWISLRRIRELPKIKKIERRKVQMALLYTWMTIDRVV